jgi:DNA-directed RNA polymerase alpha subunit
VPNLDGDAPVADTRLGLTLRVVNTLEANGIISMCELRDLPAEALLAMKNLGATTLKQLRKAVLSCGLTPPSDWGKSRAPRTPRTSRRRRGADPFAL